MGLFRSSDYLRYTVPGQILYDQGMTALEEGNYRWAALNFTGMAAEQVLFVLTLGQSMVAKGTAVCERTLAGKVSKEKIGRIADDMSEWLGRGAKIVKNEAGDPVFLSKDMTRRVRFDFKNPYPHQNPHAHVEELIGGKWIKSGPIYPTDVLPR